jgi:hypothetical protein
MLGPAFCRVAAFTALVLATGCSFGLTEAPQRIADPTLPIACSDSAARPLVDLLGFTGAAGVAAVADGFHQGGFRQLDATEAVAIGVAVVYATAAVYGAHQVNRCLASRELNTRCRSGDPQACVTLSPDWRQTPAPPSPPSPTSPAAASDGPPSDPR